MKTPWTPGPWRVTLDCVCADGKIILESQEAECKNDYEQQVVNATLAALAPEMAEAILRCEEGADDFQPLMDIARRLREIGQPK
jgi:hypothetical protein